MGMAENSKSVVDRKENKQMHFAENETKHLVINTKKYHVFAPMGIIQLELIYLYFPPSSHLEYLCFCPVGLSLL